MIAKCPRCGKGIHKNEKESSVNFPFCSRRCKLLDLEKWFDNKYKIPSPLEDDKTENNGKDND